MNKNFFKDVYEWYSTIIFPKEYSEIVRFDRFLWYLADDLNGMINIDANEDTDFEIFEIDIKSAFPTICSKIFGENSDFIKKMSEISDKKERNIFISTNLKETGYIDQLNSISKMIITGCIFTNFNDIKLLEIKKDGIIFTASNKSTFKSDFFTNEICGHPFIFHIMKYQKYFRTNKTSYFINDCKLEKIKGLYKHIPNYISKIIETFLKNEEIDSEKIVKIYSNKYLSIILENSLFDLLNYYYICDNSLILSRNGKYEKFNRNITLETIDARNYLKYFIYPIILSNKII